MVALIYDQRNMLLRRDDAARDSGGTGKTQGPQGGAKASPMGFSISPHSPESYSLTLLVHTPKLVNVLVGVFYWVRVSIVEQHRLE